MKTIGFPGFGWEFEINSTAFTVFGLKIQWYGIIISIGIVLSFLLFYRLAVKKEQIASDNVYTLTLWVVPIAIVGARITYVLTRWDYYSQTDFLTMINIRGGGLAIYGAIIFGLITVLIYDKIKKLNSLTVLDALAPAVMLGQIIGRWGNFVNGEAYGWTENVEQFPWRMWLEKVVVDGETLVGEHLVHPTFIYESLWNLLGLVLILTVLYRYKKFNGQIFCAYMGWYGFGRFFIEMIRADSLYIFGNIKFSVFTGAVCFIGAVICWIIFAKKSKNEQEELEEYHSSFETIKLSMSNEGDALDQSVYDQTNDVVADDEIIDDDSELIADSEVETATSEREELTGTFEEDEGEEEKESGDGQ